MLVEIGLRRSDFTQAERHFRRAAEHNPGYLEALHGRGLARYSQMRLGEAVAPIETMLGLDPTTMPARLLRAAIIFRGRCSARPSVVTNDVSNETWQGEPPEIHLDPRTYTIRERLIDARAHKPHL
jgi:hypothetical protein